MKMKELIVAWQDSDTRRWHPVGRLGRWGENYFFAYTKGSEKSKNFEPFGWMRDKKSIYLSKKIFPLFSNRILPKSRPEYSDYVKWLGLSEIDVDEIEMLARSGGTRATDTLEIFACPAPDDQGQFVSYFFVHGLRYLLPENVARINDLKKGDRLLIALDIQNHADPSAILLRTNDLVSMVGYCPRYLSSEFSELVKQIDPQSVTVIIEQINLEAPKDMRLLCKLVAPWPKEFYPCTKGDYKPLLDLDKVRKTWEKNNSLPIEKIQSTF